MTGFLGALKIIKKSELLDEFSNKNNKIVNQLINEIKIQSFLNHPNLIKIYDFFSD
jgi:serine/threonine protein kinase